MASTEEIYNQLLESFPFKTPREEQLRAFEVIAPWLGRILIQNSENPLYLGCDAPTGVGKSLIAITTALGFLEVLKEEHGGTTLRNEDGDHTSQIWIVTQNKLLQDQYNKDFEDVVFDLRGLDNYDCYHDKGKSCGESQCGRLRGKGGEKPLKVCSFACEYDIARSESKRAPILLLNVAKALTLLKNPRTRRPALMIYDEAHGVESSLDSDASFNLTPEDLDKLGLSFHKYFSEPDDVDQVEIGMKLLAQEVQPLYEAESSAPESFRDIRRLKKCESILKKIGEFTEARALGINFVGCSNEKLDLRPLQVKLLFEKTFEFPALFLSATLLSQQGFLAMTGVEQPYMDWFSTDSPFPKENRPINFYWRMGSQPLNYGNMAEETPNVLARIESLLEKHPNDRGIIHTHTYKMAEKIYAELYPKYSRRLLFPKNAKEQKDILELHGRSANTVLISPSMTEGVDLKDDLCRFSILTKVPYLPINDPVVKARMDSNPEWYSYKTAMTIIQAAGRGVRSTEDFSTTYFVDPGFQKFFQRAKKHFPKWFTDSLNPKASGPY